MSLIVQLGTTVVSKPGSNVTSASGSGGRNVSYRDSRVAAQSSPLGTITSNASNAGTMSGQHRTLVTAVGHSGTVRTVPAVNANVTAGAFKIHSQHHRVITSTQHAQVSVVQKSQSSATIQKPSPFMELQTRKVIVPATANSKLSSELMKEAPLEKLQQSPANEEKKQPPTQIPLMYQYVLQEHNYVALPPASPPLSPAHHHSAGPKVNGAPSSASPSSLNSEPNAQHHPLHHAQLTPHNQQNPGILASRQSVHTLHSPHGGPQTPHPTRPTNLNLDDGGSDISSDAGREIEPEGEETETAPEAEGEDDSVTRCICDFEHDDGYMICCDKCSVWQHVDCMGIDRMNIPDEYMCERCQPRRVDKMRARNIQCRKREEFFHNDTSSDSSTSSTDSEPLTIVAPGVVKKRGGPGQGSGPGPAGRRKNEPLRKQPVGNPGYRQRRDSGREMVPSLATPNQRRQPTPRKKSTENKRAPRRRKQSKCGDEDKSPETWEKSPPIQSLRQWIDNYEEAVTNHYSPELRARIQSIRVNGVHSELKVPSHLLSGSSGVAKCRLTMLPNGTKILVTTCPINANQPIIELRGKYMLSQQHRALSSRNTPLPGPFLFFHRLPLPALREATEVCVDCRTYGNDARFVRRSCKPNSEVRHCVEKGTLHLFLVTLCSLEKNAEITIRHQEGANLPCCCGNPKECSAQSQIAAQNSSNLPRKNGMQEDTTRRRRGRRRTVSSSFCRDLPSPTGRTPPSPVDALSPVTVPTPVVPAPIGSPPHSPVPEKKRRLSPPSSPVPIKVKEETKMKEEVKVEPSDDEVSSSEKDKPEKVESKPLKVEKVESSPSPPPTPPTTRNTMARRSSTVNKQQPEASPDSIPGSRRLKEKEKEKEREKERDRKDDEKPVRERRGKSESEPEPKNIAVKSEPVDKNKNRALTREERKMEAIMKAFERMEKLAQKKQEAQVRQQRQKSSDKNDDQDVPTAAQRKEIPSVDKTKRRKRKGRGRSASTQQKETPQASTRLQRRTRLLRGSGRDTEPDVDQEQDNDVDPDQDVEPDADDMSSDEETQSPRSIFQDVNNKTPPPNCDKDAGSCSSQGSTPPTPLSSACLLVAAAVGPLAPGFKFPKTKKGLLTSWFKTPDGASTPEPGKAALPYMKPLSPEGVNNNLVNSGSGSAGFAKKRWLRQAISEDHADSPNGRAGPGETIECVTPLKKRRLARESMSADSPANNDFESDQPTPDEDTLDGPTPVNETVDNEMSSPDEGSQSAEDIEIPPVNRPQATFEDVPMPPVCEPPVCVPPADDFMGGDSEVDESIRFPPEPPQHFSEPETVTTHILHVPPVPLLGASMQGPPTDPRSRPRENPLKPPLMPLARPVPPLSSMNSNPPNPAPVPIVAPPAARYVAPPAPVPQPPEPPAIKRKLSISEYRQRKQRTSTDTATPKVESSPTPEPTVTNNVKPVSRSRSSSTSSSSSLSSDDESSSAPIMNKIRQLDMRAAKVGAFATTGTPSTTGSAIPSIVGGSISGLGVDPSSLVKDGEGDDKKVGSSWSSAPTLVERQRENLTERLRREFGLFVNDEAEEAERVRKQALLGAVGATSEPTAPVLLAASGLGAAPAVAPAVAPVVAPAGVPVAAPAVVPTVAPAVVPAALPAVIPAAVPVAVPVAAPAPMASAAVVATPATPPVVPGPVKDIKDKDKEKDKDMMMANPIPSLGKKKGSLPPPPPPGLPPSSVPYTTPPGANPPPPAHLMPQPPPPGTGPGPIPLQLPARGQYARARPSSGFYYPPFSRP